MAPSASINTSSMNHLFVKHMDNGLELLNNLIIITTSNITSITREGPTTLEQLTINSTRNHDEITEIACDPNYLELI